MILRLRQLSASTVRSDSPRNPARVGNPERAVFAVANDLQRAIKVVLPAGLVRSLQRRRLARIRARNSQLSTKEVFTRVYRERAWSASSIGEFQSGSGSSDLIAEAYAGFVRTFIRAHSIRSIVDLGCGDFNMGRRVVGPGATYTGVDIVDDLISANRREFGAQGVDFRCLNIIDDELPPGELCLVRQVFQHLSNAQIGSVLPKLGAYKYVLVSEHHPSERFAVVPNRDKPHGGDTRLLDNSAVFLDKPPFSLPDLQMVHSMDAPPIVAAGETIRTVLIDNSRSTRILVQLVRPESR